MHCLLTGMTANQVNGVNHQRSPNFPGLLNQMLKMTYEVTWTEPSVLWDKDHLSQYDLVVVGIAPITALGANRAYGALSIIDQLWDDPRLRLLVDAPDPIKMEPANQAMLNHPENLTKAFFSERKEYAKVCYDELIQVRLLDAIHRLKYEPWPMCAVPTLPWKTEVQFRHQLPQARKLLMLNLDQFLFHAFPQTELPKQRVWAVEPGTHPSFVRRAGTTWPHHLLPKTHRRDITWETIEQLGLSGGCLISPSRSGTWWSPRYAMSLSQRTPVFTDWQETQYLSTAWTHLPGAFERMDHEKRAQVADEQFSTYVAAIPFDMAPVGDS